MVRSMFWAGTPSPTDRAPCGSRSISRTFRPHSTSAAPRLIVDVVLPTPPFWLHIAMTRAGPCSVSGFGSGSGRWRARAGSSREAAAPISGSVSCGRATAGAASARVALGLSPPPRARSRSTSGAVSRPARSGNWEVTDSGLAPQGGTPHVVEGCQHWGPLEPKPLVKAANMYDRRVADSWRLVPGPRVAGGVDLAQPVDGDQCVDLRRRHRGVAEQFLHHADVGTAVEQVRGEGVPQGVRRDR